VSIPNDRNNVVQGAVAKIDLYCNEWQKCHTLVGILNKCILI
jgi:hypothetical protein